MNQLVLKIVYLDEKFRHVNNCRWAGFEHSRRLTKTASESVSVTSTSSLLNAMCIWQLISHRYKVNSSNLQAYIQDCQKKIHFSSLILSGLSYQPMRPGKRIILCSLHLNYEVQLSGKCEGLPQTSQLGRWLLWSSENNYWEDRFDLRLPPPHSETHVLSLILMSVFLVNGDW